MQQCVLYMYMYMYSNSRFVHVHVYNYRNSSCTCIAMHLVHVHVQQWILYMYSNSSCTYMYSNTCTSCTCIAMSQIERLQEVQQTLSGKGVNMRFIKRTRGHSVGQVCSQSKSILSHCVGGSKAFSRVCTTYYVTYQLGITSKLGSYIPLSSSSLSVSPCIPQQLKPKHAGEFLRAAWNFDFWLIHFLKHFFEKGGKYSTLIGCRAKLLAIFWHH